MSECKFLSLAEVCRAVPALEGRHPHLSAAWRWCRRGVLARNGQRIKLRHTRLGRRVVVPEDAVKEFLDAVALADALYFDSAPATPSPPLPKPAKPALRRRQIAEAEASCKKWGI